MIALSAAIKDHWHAVERDLLSLGYHADDIGSKLTLCELISVVVAAPPGSALHHYAGAWTREAELLANLGEQQAGVLSLNARYARPGVESRLLKPQTEFDTLPAYKGIALQAMPVDEFTPKLKERQRQFREGKR